MTKRISLVLAGMLVVAGACTDDTYTNLSHDGLVEGEAVYLSDLSWTQASNGWGPVERDRSNGERRSNDGRRITLNGTVHAKGLGVHAQSDVRYRVDPACSRFLATVGVDDEVGNAGSVVFRVFADGRKRFDSGTMRGSSASKNIDVDVLGIRELRLVVVATGDGNANDHADWAAARFSCRAPSVDPDAGSPVADGGKTPIDAGTTPVDAGGTRDSGMSGADAGSPPTGIWQPRPGTTWQWQLTGTIDTSLNVAMYDIDLFDTSQATINQLRSAGRIVICYFSAGSAENWRSDYGRFPAAGLGSPLDGWPGERWIDTRNATVRDIMKARLDLAVQKGCHGVEPDNVDGYTNGPGFPLTSATQLDYNRFLAREAHARGLSIGLKNDLDQVEALVADFDWALNEECNRYSECDMLQPFIDANKAVFHVEYGDAALAGRICPSMNAMGFDTLIKRLDLDAWRVACR